MREKEIRSKEYKICSKCDFFCHLLELDSYCSVCGAVLIDTKIYDFQISQLYFGGLAKLRIGSGAGIHPYARAGAGLYTGDAKKEYSDEAKLIDPSLEDEKEDFKSAFGFNLGGGIEIDVSTNTGIFAELVYHMVNRELDMEGAEKKNMGSIVIYAGIQIGL